jgi:hypothetical protein
MVAAWEMIGVSQMAVTKVYGMVDHLVTRLDMLSVAAKVVSMDYLTVVLMEQP